jgi:hypothetical protein
MRQYYDYAFEDEEINRLSAAFAKPWPSVAADFALHALPPEERRATLASSLMHFLRNGESDPTRLANAAIFQLRRISSLKCPVGVF